MTRKPATRPAGTKVRACVQLAMTNGKGGGGRRDREKSDGKAKLAGQLARRPSPPSRRGAVALLPAPAPASHPVRPTLRGTLSPRAVPNSGAARAALSHSGGGGGRGQSQCPPPPPPPSNAPRLFVTPLPSPLSLSQAEPNPTKLKAAGDVALARGEVSARGRRGRVRGEGGASERATHFFLGPRAT